MSASWLEILSRPIAFHPCFVKITGSVNAALMLSQAMYWSKKTKDKEGWFYKSRDEWFTETCLTRREQEGARKLLRNTGIWKERRAGSPAKLYYRLDLERLEEALVRRSAVPTRRHKTAQLDGTKPPNQMAQNRPTPIKDSETTTETTTENSLEAALRAARLTDIRRMMSALNKKIGPIPKPTAEGAAAKWLLEAGYSIEVCLACLEALSQEKWRTNAVTWMTVKSQIGAWTRKNEIPTADSQEHDRPVLRKGLNE